MGLNSRSNDKNSTRSTNRLHFEHDGVSADPLKGDRTAPKSAMESRSPLQTPHRHTDTRRADTPGPRHDRRLHPASRERILVAADQVFGTKGESGSTEEVARLAGVGIATVFRHFPTKEALIEAALVRHFTGLLDRTRAAAAAPDPTAALPALIREMIERGASKLTLASMLDDAPLAVVAVADELKTAVDIALGRAQAAGAVRPDVDVEELYLLIRGLAQTTAATPVPAQMLTRAIDVILDGLSIR
jgi:AcrR family transcriptional regulator